MKLKSLLFILFLFGCFISCSKEELPDYSIKESSGEIYVNGELMPVNHKSTRIRLDDYYYVVYITEAEAWGPNSFMMNFKRGDYILKEGDVTNDIGLIQITNFMSTDTYLASGNIRLIQYDEKNQYITLRFDDVVFKDRKITSSVISLKGEIKFPIRDVN